MIGTVVDEERVGGLTIKNNTVLLLDQNANQMVSFTSAVDSNGSEVPATVTIDDENKTLTKNVDNRVYLLANKNLNVASDPDAHDYGKVTGMTFFGIYRNSSGNIHETGIDNSNMMDKFKVSKIIKLREKNIYLLIVKI